MTSSELLAVEWTKAQPKVAGYISSLIPNFHQAEEVLHQVAAILVRKFDQYDTSQPFAAWAMGIARLEVLKHRRNQVTDRHVFSDAMVERVETAYSGMADQLDARREALAECFKEVEPRGRQALRLRYVEDLKPARIAEQIDMTPGSARVYLHRIRAALRACVERRLQQMESR